MSILKAHGQQGPTMNRRGKILLAVSVILPLFIWAAWNRSWLMASADHFWNHKGSVHGNDDQTAPIVVNDHRLVVTPEIRKALKLQTAEVTLPPPVDTLRLPGSIGLDPNRLLRVHSRFSGEIIRIARVKDTDSPGVTDGERTLRYGDAVQKGQVIAIVWSREIGEKKSELVDAISKMHIDKSQLDRLLAVEEGVVAERIRLDARRTYEGDLVTLARVERTLRSWKLTEDEIKTVYDEADEVRNGKPQPANDSSWAELEIRSPLDGVVLEKNVNEGAIVDTSDDLFKIADTTVLQVLVNAYEEQLPVLTALPDAKRVWKIETMSDSLGSPRTGRFALIGRTIDPQQHTARVVGWLDNTDSRLTAGQFVTAIIEVPSQGGLVIPTRSLIEEGNQASVLVQSQNNPDEFTLQPVSIARRERDRTFLRPAPEKSDQETGLAAGDKVVVSGVLTLVAELRRRQATESPQP
jgi:membrane fusion protein, heavy metal efflux system